jgi:hypothetical protein
VAEELQKRIGELRKIGVDIFPWYDIKKLQDGCRQIADSDLNGGPVRNQAGDDFGDPFFHLADFDIGIRN